MNLLIRILLAAVFFHFTYSAMCAEPHHHKHHYGYIPDDAGIKKINVINNRKVAFVKVAASVDLRSVMPPVYDQGQIGSCTGNGSAAVYDFDNFKRNGSYLTPSRLFIYYGARVIEGDPEQDNGAQIHDVVQVLQQSGTPTERTWPYNTDQFATKPSASAYSEATKHQALHAYSVDFPQIQAALTAGFPVVFGTDVYTEINDLTASDYKMPMPAPGEQPEGGHCMVICGYFTDSAGLWFWVRNSWGTGWGLNGYCLIPAAYIKSYASDFWVVDSVSPNAEPTPTPAPPAPVIHSWVWRVLHGQV